MAIELVLLERDRLAERLALLLGGIAGVAAGIHVALDLGMIDAAIAAVLDHIDRHGTMEHYASIKERLVQAADRAIIGVDDPHCEAIAVRLDHSGKPIVRISLSETLGAGIHVRGREIFAWRGHGRKLVDLTGIGSLRGDHNAQNAAAAVADRLGHPARG